MQTIREAKIIIHLEQGKVELKAPDLSAYLKQQQQQIDLAKQLEEQLKRVDAAQRAANSGASSGGGSSGGGGSGGGGGRQSYEERSMERTLKLMQEEERALARLRSAMSALGGAAQQAGEGFFRLARAAALLGASNDSLQQMVKSLAEVQAYWDLFAGTIAIIQAMLLAQKAVAAAQAVYVTALAASTLATQAFMVAVIEATAALVSFLIPFAVVAAIVGGVIIAAMAAWDALTTSEEEAAEAARAYNEAVQKGFGDNLARLEKTLELQQELAAASRAQMTLAEQQASLAGSRASSGAFARGVVNRLGDIDPAARGQALDAAKQAAMEAIRFGNEELALAIKRRDAEVEIRQEKIKQIESAERALQTAERQKQIEEDKLRAFQAQVGALSKFEQDQLINIRDRLRRGEQLNQFEEEFLAQNGGEGGRKAVNDIRSKRGAAAGFGVDFWEGTAGAGAVKDMAKASEDVAKALAELAKLLGDAGSAAEAKARYEAQIKVIEETSAKEIEALKKAWDQNLETLTTITEKLKELEQAVITG